jgi:hypothetical protein
MILRSYNQTISCSDIPTFACIIYSARSKSAAFLLGLDLDKIWKMAGQIYYFSRLLILKSMTEQIENISKIVREDISILHEGLPVGG